MNNRILGFDLARAYAIFGMYIVNFNTVFGSHTDHSGLSGFLNLFNGNSSSTFVMLAGMGVSLMSNRADYTVEEKQKIRSTIIRRSWFLFVFGIIFYLWWPADILHFYGGYMHFAAFLVFLPRKYFLYAALFAILIFHILLSIIPYDTGWNFNTLMYEDFWTIKGFIRNTFYNGWNAIFPWIAYFFLGMYLGRLDWNNPRVPRAVLIIGISIYAIIFSLQNFAPSITKDQDLLFYLTADYLPPFLPFMLGTASFGMILISIFIFIGKKVSHTSIARVLASTGQMTLTHYVSHLFFGIIILALIEGKNLSYDILNTTPSNPSVILSFATAYFVMSCVFSYLWLKRFKHGPLERGMRGR